MITPGAIFHPFDVTSGNTVAFKTYSKANMTPYLLTRYILVT